MLKVVSCILLIMSVVWGIPILIYISGEHSVERSIREAGYGDCLALTGVEARNNCVHDLIMLKNGSVK